ALPNRLFRNQGGLRFEDVTAKSGAGDTGWTQAVSHVDFDRDGRQDLIVANDYGRNAFLRNLGDGRFEDKAPALGITTAFHSMNVGVADLNDDDHPDIYISNIAMLVKDDKYSFPDLNTPLHFDLRALANMRVKESDVLYMSRVEGERLVAYQPSTDIERGPTSTGWAWDAEFFDFDLDGDEDLYLVNGTNDFHAFAMVYRRLGNAEDHGEYLLGWSQESKILFENEGGKLRNAAAKSGADFVGNSRSTAYLDFDADGDLDIAVANFHARARFFRNDAERRGNHWIEVRLVGDPSRGSNRDAIGARLVATTAEGLRIRREIQGGSGYLSMNPKRQHLGLGRAEAADLRIVWPNGDEEILRGLAANRAYVLRQGSGVAEAAAAQPAGLE
ncbi:MAG: CRTAC1 family protein, partial [Myxococcales bacterium]